MSFMHAMGFSNVSRSVLNADCSDVIVSASICLSERLRSSVSRSAVISSCRAKIRWIRIIVYVEGIEVHSMISLSGVMWMQILLEIFKDDGGVSGGGV